MSRQRFVELMEDAVVALPIDLKTVLRIVEDPDMDDESRTMIAGALLHVLSQSVAIPGVRGVLQHVGSVLLIRLAIVDAQKRSPEPLTKHAEDWPELFGPLAEQLEAARSFLGEGMSVLDAQAKQLHKNTLQGHDAVMCVKDTDSSTWLYDAVHEAEIEIVEIDEDEVAREVKNVERIRRALLAKVERG